MPPPPAPTAQEIRAAGETDLQAVGILVMQGRITEDYQTRPNEEQEARQRRHDALTASIERTIQMAAERGATEEQIARIRTRLTERLNDGDSAMIVAQLNKHLRIERTATIDPTLKRARYDDRDLRDVDALMAAHGLNENDRVSLSKTVGRILLEDREITMHPSVGLAVVSRIPKFKTDDVARRLGIIPPPFFERGYEFQVAQVQQQGTTIVRITGTRPGRTTPTVLIETRPDQRYRMTRLVRYDENGEVAEEYLPSNYQPEDGILVPRRTEQRVAGYESSSYCIRIRTVTRVRFNQQIDPTRFEVPSECFVQDTRTATRAED